MHQLGYAWRDGRLPRGLKAQGRSAASLASLIALVTLGPYLLSMVSVPGEAVSSSSPPKLPMLLLGSIQIGVAMALASSVRRWLDSSKTWTVVVLVNGMTMTIFLWHLTAPTLITGLALQLGNVGLTVEPGSGPWWATRPLWLCVDLFALVGLALTFGMFERGGGSAPPAAGWRQIAAAALICRGLALLALNGVGGDGWLGLRWWVVLLPFVGAVVGGVIPPGRNRQAVE